MISGAHGLLRAVNSLQLKRDKYDVIIVIDRNEYLISALSESTFPWVYSLQFLFTSTHHTRRYERKCEWVFFLNTVYNKKRERRPSRHRSVVGGCRFMCRVRWSERANAVSQTRQTYGLSPVCFR